MKLGLSSLFLLPHLPQVTVKADEKETTWTSIPPNKGERGQWGETRWVLGRGRTGASRKAGEREEHHLGFCAAAPGAESWCTWQQDWENKKGYWKSLDLLSFLLSKGGFSPPETSSWMPTAENHCCAISHRLVMRSLMHDVFLILGHFYLLWFFLVVEQCFPVPQLALCGADPKSTGFDGDLPAWQDFWSGTQPVRSHPYTGLETAAAGIPSPSCSPPTSLCLGNKEMFGKLRGNIQKVLCIEIEAQGFIVNQVQFIWAPVLAKEKLLLWRVWSGQVRLMSFKSNMGMLHTWCLACR